VKRVGDTLVDIMGSPYLTISMGLIWHGSNFAADTMYRVPTLLQAVCASFWVS
jgi:hypothetical protein